MIRRSRVLAVCLLVLPAAFPAALQGQGTAGRGIEFRPVVVGGMTGGGDGSHAYYGAQATVAGSRFGVTVQGHLGRGNAFTSTYLGAGPAARFHPHPRTELRLFAGVGIYRESPEGDPRTRSVVGPSGGLLALVEVGPVRVGGGVTGWRASYSGSDVVASVPGSGLRMVLAVGR